MAVPAEMTTKNLSGRFVLNRLISDVDKLDEVLKWEGIGWILRKGAAIATITMHIKHYETESGVERIDITNTLTGGIPGSNEVHLFDNSPHEIKDVHFGHLVLHNARVKENDVTSAFLKQGWTQDTLAETLITQKMESDTKLTKTTWVENHVWGIEEQNGIRRYARHIEATGPKGEVKELKLLFDYIGPLL